MLRGTIRANHPSGQHAHGDAVFQKEPQRFVVDPTANECVFVKDDKPLDEMVFTVAFYDSLRPKIGAQLAVEPVGAPSGDAAAQRISDLEDALSLMRVDLAAAQAGEERAKSEATDLERQLKAEQTRAADLEQQLAAAKAPVAAPELPTEPAAPAAPATPKVKAPK